VLIGKLSIMSDKYKILEPERPYFITYTLVRWIKLFQVPEYANIVIDTIRYCQANKELELFAYCIMPSHVHLMARSPHVLLSGITRDIKKYSSFRILEHMKNNPGYDEYLSIFGQEASKIKRNRYYKVWQDGYHPEVIISNKFFYQKLEYIHNNPVTDGLVENSEDFLYSSARNYAGLEAVLEIIQEMPRIRFKI
jgi:putative transposase